MAQEQLTAIKGVSETLQDVAKPIADYMDSFCAQHLDAEYAALGRKLLVKLSRKRPSPLLRGDSVIWAGPILYTLGRVNFLFDPKQKIHMTGDQLSTLIGIPKSTIANKSRVICDMFNLGPFTPEFCRQDMLQNNPLVWMIRVNGFHVDARTQPPEIQAEARRLGLIPEVDSAQSAS